MPGETIHSRESDPGLAREVAERGLILKTTVGSELHGLSNPGTDDDDQLGVTIEPPAYLLGFQRFEHFVYRTQPDGHPSGPGVTAELEAVTESVEVPERPRLDEVDAFVTRAYRTTWDDWDATAA